MFIKGLTVDPNQHFLIQWPIILFVCSHVSDLSFLFNKVQKKPDETKIHAPTFIWSSYSLSFATVCAGIMMMTTTKYCQYTIRGYVSSVHLLFDSKRFP